MVHNNKIVWRCVISMSQSVRVICLFAAYTDIGYLMGIAHRKLQDKNQYSKNRQNRNVDDTGDIEIQRKCPYTDF